MNAATQQPPESTRGQLGQGIYSLAELRLYLTFHGTPRNGELALYWLQHALNPVGHRPQEADYSFADLISLLVVRALVARDVPLHRIQEAEAYGRKLYGVDRPFVTHDLATDGRMVFYYGDNPAQVESANRGGGQQAGRELLSAYLHDVRYRDGRASTWEPADQVVLDPRVQFGAPVVAGTRVLTESVVEIADASGIEAASDWLDIPVVAARSATRFEHKLAALRG